MFKIKIEFFKSPEVIPLWGITAYFHNIQTAREYAVKEARAGQAFHLTVLVDFGSPTPINRCRWKKS